jgi:tetratricopeptide (TPR) repeat protein
VTGYLVAASLLKETPAAVTAWLDNLKTVDAPVEDADRLAWVAYQAGNFDLAKNWLTKAPAHAPIAQWLRAKLLLREGKVAEALPMIAEVAAQFPRDADFRIARDTLDDGEIFDAKRAHAEIGGLQLARGDYVAALDALLQGRGRQRRATATNPNYVDEDRHWPDAAYVAEQVLTLAELKEFVDRRWPTAKPPVEGKTPEGADTRMRYLLARRLARQGMLDAAAPYYPAEQQENFRRYADSPATRQRPPNCRLATRRTALDRRANGPRGRHGATRHRNRSRLGQRGRQLRSRRHRLRPPQRGRQSCRTQRTRTHHRQSTPSEPTVSLPLSRRRSGVGRRQAHARPVRANRAGSRHGRQLDQEPRSQRRGAFLQSLW